MFWWAQCCFHKKPTTKFSVGLAFFAPCGSVGHSAFWYVLGWEISGGTRYARHVFFMLRWERYRLHKKHVGTRYAEPVFLHPVGFTVHVMHSGVSVAQNIDALFFILRWDECGFHKK
jgi:hypothetical protein